MIEVFKTNVRDKHQAERILNELHKQHNQYQANFDLQDCDNILRVKSVSGLITTDPIIKLVNRHGYHASVLE